jgi:coenzyme Q-binding protein COQ10
MPVVKKSIDIAAPVNSVFAIAVDPTRWEHWYSGLSSPDQITGAGGPGSVIATHYAMMGMRLPIQIKVLDVEASSDKSVWKGNFTGGISGTQTFTYTPKEKNTHVDVEIDYTVPGSILGKIANSLFIEKLQENATEQTLANLKALVEHT